MSNETQKPATPPSNNPARPIRNRPRASRSLAGDKGGEQQK